jgi:hypothetical protein
VTKRWATDKSPAPSEPECTYERLDSPKKEGTDVRYNNQHTRVALKRNASSSTDLDLSPTTETSRPSSNPIDQTPTFYPPTLPSPDILRRLINVFFTCVPFAACITHRPRFLQAIDEGNPLSPKYPSTAFLHAICAIASLHAHEIFSREKKPSFEKRPLFEIYVLNDELKKEQGLLEEMGISFGEEHASMSLALMQDDFGKGRKLLDALAACIIISRYKVSINIYRSLQHTHTHTVIRLACYWRVS